MRSGRLETCPEATRQNNNSNLFRHEVEARLLADRALDPVDGATDPSRAVAPPLYALVVEDVHAPKSDWCVVPSCIVLHILLADRALAPIRHAIRRHI